ncbi:MAG: hypothetical protein HPY83_08835 [Anaerolineae bacterium]|nr:hypothetical protein [Anaerolineae bacterium]
MPPLKRSAPGWQARGGQRNTDGGDRHPHSSGTPVRNQSGKVVGTVASGVLRKRVRAREHFLRTPPAIAWDVRTLLDAQHLGALATEVTDTDSGRTYSAPLGLFWSKGIRLNRGHGEQLALPLALWKVSDPGEPAVRQLGLFEAVMP